MILFTNRLYFLFIFSKIFLFSFNFQPKGENFLKGREWGYDYVPMRTDHRTFKLFIEITGDS